MATIEYSDNDVINVETQNNKIEIKINFSNYTDEKYIITYINNVITSLNETLTGIKEIFSSAVKYFNELDDISNNTAQPDILDFSFDEIESLALADVPLIGIGTGTVNTQNGNLNLRSEPNKNSNVVNRLAKGTTFKILEDDNGSGWLKVEDNDGNIGYVSSDYIVRGSDLNIAEVNNESIDVPNCNARVKLTSGKLNIRSTPNGEIIGQFDNNASINIVEYVPNGWTKIKLDDGKIAYVYSKYLEVNDEKEN